jgi:hypothetical protein
MWYGYKEKYTRTEIFSLSPYHYFLCFAYSYTLKIKAAYSSETSADI